MKSLKVLLLCIIVSLTLNFLMSLTACFSRSNASSKYDALIEGSSIKKPLVNPVTCMYSTHENEYVWRATNDVNSAFVLKDVEIGHCTPKFFKKDIVHPIERSDVIEIENYCGLKLNDPAMIKDYDAQYIAFTYRGYRYFIAVCHPDKTWFNMQVFGKMSTINTSIEDFLKYGVSVDNRTKFYFANFYDHIYFLSNFKIGNNERMKVYRSKMNELMIEFHDTRSTPKQ